MNGFVRQIAVLSVLWTVCEMLLPDGKQQHMVRVTASLLIMTSLVTTAHSWLGRTEPSRTAMALRVQQVSEDTYRQTALQAAANQLENLCETTARRAGYRSSAAVYLTLDGALDHLSLTLEPCDTALVSPAELRGALAQMLDVREDCVWLLVEEK